jgi:hypothetical protein
MKRLVVTVTMCTFVVMVLFSISVAQAASDDEMSSAPGPRFHALSRIPEAARADLTPLTHDELATVAGAGPSLFGVGGLRVNLGIVVQINVCALCAGVTQTNFAALGQGLGRFGAPR